MTFLAASRANYSARLARAELLGAQHLFATEILTFYRKIATFQKEFYDRLPKAWGKQPVVPVDGNLRSTLHLPVLIGPFGDFLLLVQTAAPAPLAERPANCGSQEKDAVGSDPSDLLEFGL